MKVEFVNAKNQQKSSCSAIVHLSCGHFITTKGSYMKGQERMLCDECTQMYKRFMAL